MTSKDDAPIEGGPALDQGTISSTGPSHPTEGITTLRGFVNGVPIYAPLGWKAFTFEIPEALLKSREAKP